MPSLKGSPLEFSDAVCKELTVNVNLGLSYFYHNVDDVYLYGNAKRVTKLVIL